MRVGTNVNIELKVMLEEKARFNKKRIFLQMNFIMKKAIISHYHILHNVYT